MTDLELAMSRTWAEINLDELAHNIKTLRNMLNPHAKFCGVVKANAYGHGMIAAARKLQECGADYLAVAAVTEGAELRQNGITLPVLCLGQADTNLAPLMCEHNITQAVGDVPNAKALSDYAQSVGKKIRIHVKIDTGMSRTGFYWPENDESLKDSTAREILEVCRMPGLEAEGLFTHFAVADDDPGFTHLQLRKLLDARARLEALGQAFRLVHASASSGVLYYPEAHLDMARFGLSLYGYASPDVGNEGSTAGLHPVMTVKSRITAVRKIPAGETVSYGRLYTLKRDSVIAVMPVGYADGYPRVLTNQSYVKIHGVMCPTVGRVCMDMTMADVTDIPGVRAGDVATIYDYELMPQAAQKAGTIIDEIVCRVMPRIKRVYINDGKMTLKI